MFAFTAVNSTTEATREFTNRQILLNAEFTPVSSPSGSARTESDSARSPTGLTPLTVAATPAASSTQEAGPPPPPDATDAESRPVLSDVTSTTTNTAPAQPEKRRRGRPKGWRKPLSKAGQTVEDLTRATEPVTKPPEQTDATEPAKPAEKRRRKEREAKDDDAWSKRIRASIQGTLLDHIAQGIVPHMCYCCGDITPASWRLIMVNERQERFCNGTFFFEVGANE